VFKRLKLTFLFVPVLVLTITFAFSGSPALAAEQAWWQISSSTWPAHLQPGGEAKVVVQATNLGDEAINATNTPVTVTDVLPPHVTPVTGIVGIAGSNHTGGGVLGEVTCESLPKVSEVSEVSCTWAGPEPLQPYEQLEVIIPVKIEEHAQSGEENEASVAGGESYLCNEVDGTGRFATNFCKVKGPLGLAEAEPPDTGDFEGESVGTVPGRSLKRPLSIEAGPTPFGVEDYSLAIENEDGAPDTQAGSHPFQFTTTLALNQTALPSRPPAFVKDLHVKLPSGLVGNPTAIPQCAEAEFYTPVGDHNLCPPDTVVGVAAVTVELVLTSFFINKPTTYVVPVFNLAPAHGEPARFGFVASTVPVTIDTSVRSGEDYGVVASTDDTTQSAAFLSSRITLWGVPGDSRHDRSRGWSCVSGGFYDPETPCSNVAESQPQPFLTLPTSCTGSPLETSVQADSWPTAADPAGMTVPPLTPEEFGEPMESLDGCNRLAFGASLSVAPDSQSASSPSGLTVKVHVPQEASLNPTGLAESDVRDTTVTLPEGVALNPAGADGLEACSNMEIGFERVNPQTGTDEFTPKLPEPLEPGHNLDALGFCSDASKIGTVKITTPILKHPLEGAVYLAAQDENPFGSLVAMYIVAEEPESGVLVKLPGEVSLNAATGQITSTFLNTPQDPFENLELHLFGGERGPLSTPAHCGMYAAKASFAPWSGNASVTPSSSFEITSGPDGSPCPGASLPFVPSLTSGTTDNQAAAFSPLTTTISREDGNQSVQAVTLHTPPGLSGLLSDVKLCGEPQAEEGLCGPESLIGETTVSVGVGGDPYTVTGGKVYMTGPYAGAPFGLSIDTPAKAGPFDLEKDTPCDCIVVRAKVEVDPSTAQLTITTDGKDGAHPIPHIVDGIPVQIKHVNVTVNRPGFTFNPTNCDPLAITGTITSTEEAATTLSVPFQVANCATLKFPPQFSVSTSAHTSKAGGASLTAKLVYPVAPQGTQANIAMTKVDLPKILPSRLTTLQKACLAVVFEANPESCPAASVVGHATVTTRVLPVPLAGSAYLVSHGGEAWPALTMVLKGYGVTIDLVGTTFIKSGITSTTFKAVPDTPFNTFELTLPEGKYSALAANGNLCKHKLVMPTAFVAQNGAEIHESTPIKVIGCPKARKTKNGKKASSGHTTRR
jgi:hypothetical protein